MENRLYVISIKRAIDKTMTVTNNSTLSRIYGKNLIYDQSKTEKSKKNLDLI